MEEYSYLKNGENVVSLRPTLYITGGATTLNSFSSISDIVEFSDSSVIPLYVSILYASFAPRHP